MLAEVQYVRSGGNAEEHAEDVQYGGTPLLRFLGAYLKKVESAG